MSCGWEGNHRCGRALAMRHRLQWLSSPPVYSWAKEERWAPHLHSSCGMAHFPLLYVTLYVTCVDGMCWVSQTASTTLEHWGGSWLCRCWLHGSLSSSLSARASSRRARQVVQVRRLCNTNWPAVSTICNIAYRNLQVWANTRETWVLFSDGELDFW